MPLSKLLCVFNKFSSCSFSRGKPFANCGERSNIIHNVFHITEKIACNEIVWENFTQISIHLSMKKALLLQQNYFLNVIYKNAQVFFRPAHFASDCTLEKPGNCS